MTLTELMVCIGIGTLVCAASVGTLVFAGRTYQALTNYQDMNAKSRLALDILSTDIRQANGCSTNETFSATSLTLTGANAVSLLSYTSKYDYDAATETLTRTYSDANGARASVLLSNCTHFAFSYFMRNTTNASFEVYSDDSGRADLCKLIQVDWTLSRPSLGTTNNTQKGESARVVIRKG